MCNSLYIIQDVPNEGDVIHITDSSLTAAVAGVKRQHSLEAAGSLWVDDYEPRLIRLLVQAAETHHVVGICSAAVKSQNDRRGRI